MYEVSEPSGVWKVERRPRASKRLSLLALSGPTEQEICLSSYNSTCTHTYHTHIHIYIYTYIYIHIYIYIYTHIYTYIYIYIYTYIYIYIYIYIMYIYTHEYCVKRQLQRAYRRVVQGWAWSLLSSQRRDTQIHYSSFRYFESKLIKLWWKDRKLSRQGLLTFASSPAVKGFNLPVQSTDESVCFTYHSVYMLLDVACGS